MHEGCKGHGVQTNRKNGKLACAKTGLGARKNRTWRANFAVGAHQVPPCVRATGYCRAMDQCAPQRHSARHNTRYGSGSWVCNPMS